MKIDFFDVLAVAGAVSFGYGLYLMYPPLMWIFAGTGFFIAGVCGARIFTKQKRKK